MNLKDQVTNLELSKKLKELGVTQNSLFYWSDYPGAENYLWDKNGKKKEDSRTNILWYSAFTVAELGEILPDSIDINDINNEYDGNKLTYYLTISKDINWVIEYLRFEISFIDTTDTTDQNLANTMAKMLIYLLENNLIKL